MKKLILSLFLLSILLFNNATGQCITDANFKAAIASDCPACIDINGCLLPTASTLQELDVAGKNIADISGIEGFTSLQTFYCNNNLIGSIPPLPDSLKVLYCSDNVITSLPSELPYKLQQLKCENNQLTSLPLLPGSLQTLFCSDNLLSELPPLPNNLDNLTCNDNHLFSLPPLPALLTSIHCNLNQLYQLPELPSGLKKLFCEQNQLISLPSLPASLTTLDINGNPIACLPELPYDLQLLSIDFTNITCLPNLPAIFQVFSPLPLCLSGSGNNCALNPVVSGNVFVDFNGDGFKDAEDVPFPGIAIKASAENWAGYSDQFGNYAVNGPFGGTYSYSAVLPPGNYSVNPAAPYSFTFNDTSGQEKKNINFGIHPAADVYDLGISITPGQIVSGVKTNYYITYTNKGPFAINGSVQFQHDDKVSFIGADINPFLQNGTVLTWAISALPPFTSQTVTAKFDIPSSVLAGTELAFTALGIISGASDIYLNDNVVTDSVTVTAVAGSNYKTVNKTQIIPTTLASGNEEVEYTIYFQNNGSNPSQNLDITDTLSANLNTASFAMIGSNEAGTLEIMNVAKNPAHPLVLHWNFDDIKLPFAANDPLGSRGFVKFIAKPLTSLVQGEKILNKSIIQFSNNANPIYSNTVTTNIMFPVSVADILNGTIELYAAPNPFTNSLQVKYQLRHKEEVTLSVLNMYGTVIWEKTMDGKSEETININMDNNPPGSYIITLHGKHTEAHAQMVKL
ncbi:MAG: leucine-rich repeat domain-containing protein [Chitinophagales bacterium]|nr:leucine-rich repeat domain-containing protein [Chitinophagales bacterium]